MNFAFQTPARNRGRRFVPVNNTRRSGLLSLMLTTYRICSHTIQWWCIIGKVTHTLYMSPYVFIHRKRLYIHIYRKFISILYRFIIYLSSLWRKKHRHYCNGLLGDKNLLNNVDSKFYLMVEEIGMKNIKIVVKRKLSVNKG